MSTQVCKISDCQGLHQARGWCGIHYQRWRRYGDPTVKREPIRPTLVDRGAICEIHLPSGHIAIVDSTDRELVADYVWAARCRRNGAYVQGYRRGFAQRATRVQVQLHRLLLDAPDGVQVDHRNGDGLDNRRSNLRLATRAQNQANQRPRVDSRTGYKGVTWVERRQRWHAYIRLEGRKRSLGYFTDPWEAAQAYNAAALSKWGEYAWLNTQHAEAS